MKNIEEQSVDYRFAMLEAELGIEKVREIRRQTREFFAEAERRILSGQYGPRKRSPLK